MCDWWKSRSSPEGFCFTGLASDHRWRFDKRPFHEVCLLSTCCQCWIKLDHLWWKSGSTRCSGNRPSVSNSAAVWCTSVFCSDVLSPLNGFYVNPPSFLTQCCYFLTLPYDKRFHRTVFLTHFCSAPISLPTVGPHIRSLKPLLSTTQLMETRYTAEQMLVWDCSLLMMCEPFRIEP